MSMDAATALLRALARSAPPFALDAIESHRWASATFTGARHQVRFTAADDAALARWLDEAPGADLPTRGHLVADLVVVASERSDGRTRVTLEALTLEEA